MEPIKVFFLVFLILMVMRAPMYLCLLGSSLLYIYLTPQLSMMTAMNKMMNAPNSFTLLAVPFFIFAGQVMNNGGVTDRIFGFAKKMIGHWSGGLAYVNVLSSLIFSGISGSALADVGGLGMIGRFIFIIRWGSTAFRSLCYYYLPLSYSPAYSLRGRWNSCPGNTLCGFVC